MILVFVYRKKFNQDGNALKVNIWILQTAILKRLYVEILGLKNESFELTWHMYTVDTK